MQAFKGYRPRQQRTLGTSWCGVRGAISAWKTAGTCRNICHGSKDLLFSPVHAGIRPLEEVQRENSDNSIDFFFGAQLDRFRNSLRSIFCMLGIADKRTKKDYQKNVMNLYCHPSLFIKYTGSCFILLREITSKLKDLTSKINWPSVRNFTA